MIVMVMVAVNRKVVVSSVMSSSKKGNDTNNESTCDYNRDNNFNDSVFFV